jgi:hypothetical protein
MNKNPFIAILLNLICPGFGYIYTGERAWFGVMLSAANVGQFISVHTDLLPFKFTPFMLVGLGAYYLATSLDVYQIAREKSRLSALGPLNSSTGSEQSKSEDDALAS